MATPYERIFQKFLRNIKGYSLLKFPIEDREQQLLDLLDESCDEFSNKCLQDLYNRDEVLKQFNEDIDQDSINILTQLMVMFWVKPLYYNEDNLKNMLGTKDYSVYSPANLLKEVEKAYSKAEKSAIGRMNKYSIMNRRTQK